MPKKTLLKQSDFASAVLKDTSVQASLVGHAISAED